MNKREILVLLILGVGTIYGLRSPLVAACLFTWNNIFRPLRWAKASGIFDPAVLPTHYVIPVVLGFSILRDSSSFRWNYGCTILVFILLWVWIGVPMASYPDIAYDFAVALSKYFIPIICICALLSDRRSQQIYLYVLALSVGIHLAWAGFHGVILRGGIEEDMGIPGGQMTGRNDFTVAATGCLPLLGYMAFHYVGRWQRAVRWAVRVLTLLGGIAFFYSGSRGALLGLVCLGLWWAVMTGRPARRVSIALVLCIVALPLVPDFVWERMDTIEWEGEQTEGSAVERTMAMKMGLEVTLDHPMLGVGPDNSWRVAADLGLRPDRGGIETHFIWLKCSSEYGIPMLIFFLVVIGSTLLRLKRAARVAKRAQDRTTEEIATALSCAIVGFLASGTFTSKFLSEYLWSIFAVAFAFLSTPLAATAETPPADGAESPPEPQRDLESSRAV